MKFAEAFGFGRARKIFILVDRDVEFSPVEPGRRVRTARRQRRMPRGPEGQTGRAAFFWLLFFRCWKKSNSPSRRNKMLINTIQLKFAAKAAYETMIKLRVLCALCGKYSSIYPLESGRRQIMTLWADQNKRLE